MDSPRSSHARNHSPSTPHRILGGLPPIGRHQREIFIRFMKGNLLSATRRPDKARNREKPVPQSAVYLPPYPFCCIESRVRHPSQVYPALFRTNTRAGPEFSVGIPPRRGRTDKREYVLKQNVSKNLPGCRRHTRPVERRSSSLNPKKKRREMLQCTWLFRTSSSWDISGNVNDKSSCKARGGLTPIGCPNPLARC